MTRAPQESGAPHGAASENALTPDAALPDANRGNWVDRHAPAPARPYLRLMRADRPIGVWLLVLPCWMGAALAAAETGASLLQLALHAALFAVGAVAMRGAGCVYNDIVDRDIDARVARTAQRPLASGAIRLRGALLFLAALSLTGLVVLLQFNRFTIVLGLSSLALVGLYPFMKRVTWWPQAFLGLTFNWGALVGYAAATGTIGAPALLLYAACALWTLGYDTIYAHQDREDDALIGVRSTARLFGARTKPAVAAIYALSLAGFAAAGAAAGLSPLYYLALAPAGLHLFRQIRRLDIDDAGGCLAVFRSNRETGLLIVGALLLAIAAARLSIV